MTKKVLPKTKKYIIGIDEVGRGPLAGPVTVAAILFTTNYGLRTKNFSIPLRDSKKLSPKQRGLWFKFIKQQKTPYAVSHVSSKIIDRINISNAANLAATRTLYKLITNNRQLTTNNFKIYLDGGLYIKNFPKQKNYPHQSVYNPYLSASTVIGGDKKIPAIALASIVAKVRRDKLMKKNHKKYPHYGFNKHKGYGTKLHYKQINKNGVSKIHRKTFLKNLYNKIK